MVCLLVHEPFKIRPVCLSRFYLNRAITALDNGDKIAAGCLLREAVDRYLTGLCQYHGCLPKRKRDRTPAIMLRTLYRAKQFEECGYGWVRDSIKVGNSLAHCRPVRASLVQCCIGLLHSLLDSSHELNFPTREIGGGI